ncbi:MAG TPA: hypothetical protein VLB05_08585 [Dongiaceae bacterium]|nr:hypothetical protein [Dongiaceae bacterium]
MMTDKFQILMAALATLGPGMLLPLPALATDDSHPSLLSALMRHERAPDPQRTQVADQAQTTGSSASASASASSSATVTSGGKSGKCRAEASANAKANGVEDSDHDLKVVDGDGCSAKAESSATVKPQRKQQSE